MDIDHFAIIKSPLQTLRRIAAVDHLAKADVLQRQTRIDRRRDAGTYQRLQQNELVLSSRWRAGTAAISGSLHTAWAAMPSPTSLDCA